jgi:hypothetical protein
MTSVTTDLGILIGSFLGVTAIAHVAGAANTGVAAGIGQIAFAAALVFVLARRG